jgi:hypothetical protein
MSLSSFSSLSSYTSESDISTLINLDLFKSSSSSRARARDAHARAHRAHHRRRSPVPRRIKDSRERRRSSPSPSRRTKGTTQRSVTPTRTTPISPSRYDGALVPYAPQSPGSKSGITYSDIDRWRTATVGGSDFTYSSESSVTVSSVASSSFVSSRTRSSRIDSSSRRSAASGSKRVYAPSDTSRHPHLGIHHDPSQFCEHCRTT